MESLSRRTLIGSAAAAAAGLGLTRYAHAEREEQEPKKVGWAILGLGGYATRQIMPSFKDCKHSKLVALISGTPSKLTQFGAEYGIPESHRYSYEQLEQVAKNPDIDVVYVITPPSTHRDFTVRSAKAGKHVCCEKPMAPTVEDCQAMIDACKANGKLLQIGYRSHYQNHNLRAMEACRNELGMLRSLTADAGFNMGAGTWRTQKALAGGGSMMDIGIYCVQALRYLSGSEPTTVSARIHNPVDDRFKDVEDTVHFTFEFPNGCIGTGTSGYSWGRGANRYSVIGTRGNLNADNATGYGGHRLNINGQDVALEGNNQFAAQMDHLSECIRDKKIVRTPGEMGLQDIRIIQAVYESARTGKPVQV